MSYKLRSPLLVTEGGSGHKILPSNSIPVGNGTGSFTLIANGVTGQSLTAITGLAPAWGLISLTAGVSGTLPVANGGTGAATLTDNSVLVGSGTSAVTPLTVGTDGQVLIGATAADPAFASLTSTDGTVSFTTGANTLDLALSAASSETGVHSWNGSLLETASVTVTSDGATITANIELSGGGDLTAVFSDGFYDWDTTPADTVTLTAGTDTSPQVNYIYLLQSNKTLTASTVGFPAVEHAPIAKAICQSAASLQTDGSYAMHAWTDEVVGTDDMGHINDLNEWIRAQAATWKSGVAPTLTITPNGGSADNVIFTSAAGVVLQLHTHTFPAFSGTPDIYVINDSATAFDKVTDLNTQLTDSTGASMSGKYFSLVIWGVQSEASADCKLFCNLPGGSYNNQTALEVDSNKFSDFSIPADFVGTGFLIAQLQLRHQAAASGTWTEIATIDLRGLLPSITPGGTTAFPTEFDDSTFRILDDSDPTKEIAFQASGITTATTRTITMADRNVDLSAVAEAFSGDSGSAVPSSGTLTVAGGTNITTAGASATLTVNLDSAITLTSVETDVTTAGLTISGGSIVSDGTDSDIDLILTGKGSSGGVVVTDGLTVGDSTSDRVFTINGAAITSVLAVHANGVTDLGGLAEERHSDTPGFGSHFLGLRTRGAEGAPTVVADNDSLLRIIGAGYDGTDFATSAEIAFDVDGTPGADDMPGRIEFLTSADGSQTTTLAMTIDSSQVVTLANALTAANGGTGRATHTAYAVICGGTTTTAAQQSIASVGTAAQVLTSNGAGALPTFQATAMAFTWNEETGTSATMAVNNGYIANNAAQVDLTLPDTATLGSVIRVCGKGAGGFKISQNAGETIHFGTSDTTTGVGGSIESTETHDAVELLCTVADTEWTVLSSLGNLTIT